MSVTGLSADYSFTRVTNALQGNVVLGSMSRSMRTIMELQQQIATGLRIITPSDDPVGANRVLEIQSMLGRIARYRANIQSADQRLSASGAAMTDLDDLLDEAKRIMLREVGSSATADTRSNSAIEIDNMLNQALSLANRKFGDRYLFGGNGSAEPFALASDQAVYNGDSVDEFLQISDGITMGVNVTGAAAFGALSTEIRGDADLNPIITSATLLRGLNGGEGIAKGSILVGDGLTTTTIDLSGAETIGDVVNIINNDPAGFVTASINAAGNGIDLNTTSTGNISVNEVAGNTTASDLGILQTTLAAGPVAGSDLDPALDLLTPITSLLGGAGLTSLASQIKITNGSASATIDFTGATTVQDILNKINQAGVNVVASMNAEGTGINVVSKANGARLNITDVGGGTTAAEMGIALTLERVKLADLNDGVGVAEAQGNDIKITRSDGVVIEVDISSAVTVGDIIDLINNDSENTGGLLAASVAGSGDRIALSDTSGGAGDLVVENIGASFAASNMGIAGTVANGPSPMTLTGTDLSPAGVQTESVFTALIRLRDALLAGDTGAITRAGAMIDAAKSTVLNAVAEAGSRAARLEMTDTRLEDEEVNLKAALSDVRDVNTAEAIVKLQMEQTMFQAGLATAAGLLQNSLLNYL